MAWLWWIGAALVLGVIETLTVDLTFLMLAGGAVGGAIAAALGTSFLVQAVVFAAVSTLLLAAVRPWAKWQLLSTTPDMRTNASALIGREATALTVIDERGGSGATRARAPRSTSYSLRQVSMSFGPTGGSTGSGKGACAVSRSSLRSARVGAMGLTFIRQPPSEGALLSTTALVS